MANLWRSAAVTVGLRKNGVVVNLAKIRVKQVVVVVVVVGVVFRCVLASL